jgi:hypothetical protein
LLRAQGPNGVFGYRKTGNGSGSLNGAGVFCLLIWHHAKDKAVRDGLAVIKGGLIAKGAKPPPAPVFLYKDKSANLYAWYYDTQACFQAGGGNWTWWNRKFQRQLLDNQSPDGSWPPIGPPGPAQETFSFLGTGSTIDSAVYRSSLCMLMLEVYYRYLSNSKVEGATLE